MTDIYRYLYDEDILISAKSGDYWSLSVGDLYKLIGVGSVAEVAGEYVHYSEETAQLYEQAEGYVTPTVGGLSLAPVYEKDWKTYNFEVEDFHTYIAGGVRVHNASVFTPTGLDLTVNQTYQSVNGNKYRVNADGSLTNVETEYSSPASVNPTKKYLSVGAAMADIAKAA